MEDEDDSTGPGRHVTRPSVPLRAAGFTDVLRRAGIGPGEIIRRTAGNTVAAAATFMAEVLAQPPRQRPTAVFALTDVLALGVLTAARTGGVAVPGDLSVVGFDDIAEAAASSPPLTTVSQPLFRIGQEAARIALLQLAGQRGLPRGLATKLVVRGTTGPPP